MTEQEIIKVFNTVLFLGKCELPADEANEAIKLSIKALEKIQQYREIGTVEECREAVEKQKAKQGWIPCSEKMPPVETEVFILAKRKYRDGKCKYIRTTAMYEDGTILENDSCWRWEEIEGEWDEENDCYVIPEGWWENRHYNPDEVYNNVVDDEVVAWQPLPELYITCANTECTYHTGNECPAQEGCAGYQQNGECDQYKCMTQAERIRYMTDDELADFIRELNECCLAGAGMVDCSNNEDCIDCKGVVLEWLQSEVE